MEAVSESPLFVRPARAADLFGLSETQLADLARSGVIRRYKPKDTRVVLYSVEELRSIIEVVPVATGA